MSDPLEEAHLAYIRRDLATARQIVDDILLCEPLNDEALLLRDSIEREMVEAQADAIRNEGWVSRLDPKGWQVVGIGMGGLLCVAFAAYLTVGALERVGRLGLAGKVRVSSGTGYASLPIHLLFAGPVVLTLAGVYLLWSVREFMNSIRGPTDDDNN